MNRQYLLPLIYEFIIFGLTGILIFKIWQKKRTKNNIIINNMFYFVFFLNLGILMAAISRILRYTNLWLIEEGKYLELLAITVCCLAIAQIFLLKFGLLTFQDNLKQNIQNMVVIFYSIGVGAYIIYTITTGLFVVDLTSNIWLFLIILSIIVDLHIILSSINLSRKLDDKTHKFFVNLIGFAPVSFIFIFLMFLLDRIKGGNFTVFYYIGWAFSVIAALLMYVGVIRPSSVEDWVKSKFQ